MKRWIIVSAAAFVAVIGLSLVEPANEAQARLFGGRGDCCGPCHGGKRHHHRHRHHRRCHGRCAGYDACQAYVGCYGHSMNGCGGYAAEHGSAYRGEMPPAPEATTPAPEAAPATPAPPPPPAAGTGDSPTASEATPGA